MNYEVKLTVRLKFRSFYATVFYKWRLNVESTYELSKDDSNHIVRIMRKKIEDKVYVVFNNEIKYICTIVDNNVDKVLITPYEQVIGTNELSTKINSGYSAIKKW